MDREGRVSVLGSRPLPNSKTLAHSLGRPGVREMRSDPVSGQRPDVLSPFRGAPAGLGAPPPARLPSPAAPLKARASPRPAAGYQPREVTREERQVVAHVVRSVLRISLAGHVCLPAEEAGTGRRPSSLGRVRTAPPQPRTGATAPSGGPRGPQRGGKPCCPPKGGRAAGSESCPCHS